MRRAGWLVVLGALLAGSCSPPRPKLIEFGWDCPDPATLRRDVARMEEAPFDGVVLDVPLGKRSLAWSVWSRTRLGAAFLEPAARDLRKTRFRRFTDNFLRVNATPGDVDWFDTDWPAVAYNAALCARLARRGGLKGLVLDPEHYTDTAPFDYSRRPQQRMRTYREYAAQARARGREWIQAVNDEYPDLTILCLFGHSVSAMQARNRGGDLDRGLPEEALARSPYGLLAPFLDGVLEAAHPRTRVFDVHEPSYPLKTREQLEQARAEIDGAWRVSLVPATYRRRLRAGFGLWMDNDSHWRGWHEDASRNHFTPAELETALREALRLSDGYVWVYSQEVNWWTRKGLPPAYRDAVARAWEGAKRRAVR